MANQKRMWELADLLANRGHEYDEHELVEFGVQLALLVLDEEREVAKMINSLFSRGIVDEPNAQS